MFRSTVQAELSKAELDGARLGFSQLLRRKRFSPQFIANHRDDLLATAQLEYTRRVSEGVEVENPAGWIINCAWRRTQNLLEAQGRGPRLISTERSGAITDDLGHSPEDAALEFDRFRKVQEAIEQLSTDQRKLLELAYFEEMGVREAGRFLGWHSSKAQRCHESARRRIQELLGVESLDELEIPIGLAAWLSLASGHSTGLHLPAGIEAVADKANRGAGHLWARTQELARRFLALGGGEPTGGVVAGGVVRTAGVCGAAAVACLAGGVIGPGLGGVNLLDAHHHNPAPRERAAQTADRSSAVVSPPVRQVQASPTRSPSFTSSTPETSGKSGGHHAKVEATSSSAASPKRQVEQEFSPFAGGGSTSTATPAPVPNTASSSSGGSSPSSSSSSAVSSSPAATSAARQTNQEFGAFK